MFYTCNFTSKKPLDQAIFENFTKFEEKILDLLIQGGYSMGLIKYSYFTVARIIGCSRKTVARAYSKFVSLGIISKKYVHRKALTVSVSPMLYKRAYEFRHASHSLKVIAFQEWRKVTDRNVLPFKKIMINNLLYMKDYHGQGSNKVVSFCKPTGTRLLKNIKWREMMQSSSKISISPTLREINEAIGLTRVGQLKLLVFDDTKLSIAWKNVSRSNGTPGQKFSWIVGEICRSMESEGVKPDWYLFYMLLKRHNLTDNKRYVLSAPVVKKPVVNTRPVEPRPAPDLSKYLSRGSNRFLDEFPFPDGW